ncbi:hypothetical protein [Runella sp.]|uniref:hypothetical protein n=1 Tax=Runella sp. TaxID=1960881 RepID=UPI003D13B56D
MKNLVFSFLFTVTFLVSGFAQNTKMHVKLTGGANAGTYDFSSPTTTCSCNIIKEIAFGNQFSLADGKGVTSLQLIAPDRAKAMAGTDVFYVKVAFGKRLVGTRYEIGKEAIKVTEKANGQLKLSETANSTVATVSGSTKDGVKMEIKLECFKMINNKGEEVTKCR